MNDLDARERSRIVKTAVSPRPIAWISTRDTSGQDNLAPFSSYNYVASEQPVLLVTMGRRDGKLKDTVHNIHTTHDFAVNVVTADALEAMDHTSANPEREDEFTFAGVEREECTQIDAPRVATSPVTMECTLYDSMSMHDRQVLLGDVVYIHVDESVTSDGKIDAQRLPLIGRIGGPYYTKTCPVEFERHY